MFRNMVLLYGQGLLASRPTSKLEDYLLSAARDCLFNIFAATLHPQHEDAPCYGDRDPVIMDVFKINLLYIYIYISSRDLPYDTPTASSKVSSSQSAI